MAYTYSATSTETFPMTIMALVFLDKTKATQPYFLSWVAGKHSEDGTTDELLAGERSHCGLGKRSWCGLRRAQDRPFGMCRS